MNEYEIFSGIGIDASKNASMKIASNKADVKHVYVEPDNFYSLREKFDFESLDFIYSKNLINKTKFFKILIKEWIIFCKVRGKIIIDFVDNRILSFEQLKAELNLLSKSKGKIISEEYNPENKEGRIIFEKKAPVLRKKDSIDKWSFGIITNGKNNEAVDKEIESIIALKIPKFEVIVCGEYKSKNKFKNLSIIPFDSTISWITKKKNLICENAKYENLVITHDRFTFDDDWSEGMKKYGNYFEVMSCKIHDNLGRRADDWMTAGVGPFEGYRNRGLIEYRDWDINLFICGGFYIMKKSVWEECKWDNSLVWGQGEDILLSHDHLNKGFVARFNPYSSCTTTNKRGDMMAGWVNFKFNNKRFIRIRDRPLLRRIKLYLRILFIKYLS
jgi:hypothetical protein